jgi:hypothetical protein
MIKRCLLNIDSLYWLNATVLQIIIKGLSGRIHCWTVLEGAVLYIPFQITNCRVVRVARTVRTVKVVKVVRTAKTVKTVKVVKVFGVVRVVRVVGSPGSSGSP